MAIQGLNEQEISAYSNNFVYENLSTENDLDIIINKRLNLKNKQKSKYKILIDASIILDVLLDRTSIFFDDASEILDLIFSGALDAYISELGVRYIWDISRKLKSREETNFLIEKILSSFSICKVDDLTIKKSLSYHLNSLESGIQIECAKRYSLDAIITLRAKDFLECGWDQVFSPAIFLQYLSPSNLTSQNERLEIDIIRNKLDAALCKSQADGNKEISSSRLRLFDDWFVEHYELIYSKSEVTTATVVASRLDTDGGDLHYVGSAFGRGSVSTLFQAFDRVMAQIDSGFFYRLSSIKVINQDERVYGPVTIDVELSDGNRLVRERYTHTNLMSACFFAYIEGIKSLLIPDRCTSDNVDVYHSARTFNYYDLVEYYDNGFRDFSSSNLSKIDMSNSEFYQVNFRDSDLSHSDLSKSSLIASCFSHAKLQHSCLDYIDFSECDLSFSSFNYSSLRNATLSNVILTQSELVECILTDSNFEGASISCANFSNSDASRANFFGADLTNSNLNNVNFINADLRNTNLTGVNLASANLKYADLCGANLTSSNLQDIDFSLVQSIKGANFTNSDLSYSNLGSIDLDQAIFCNTRIVDTVMPNVKVEIYGKKRIERTIEILDQIVESHYTIYAIHSDYEIDWWDTELGRKFWDLNLKLLEKNIQIFRVFTFCDYDNLINKYQVLKEQKESGVEVRVKLFSNSEYTSKNFYLNSLICSNEKVTKNSFTSYMTMKDKHGEETGYFSFDKDDISCNYSKFQFYWESNSSYSLEQVEDKYDLRDQRLMMYCI